MCVFELGPQLNSFPRDVINIICEIMTVKDNVDGG